MGIRARPPGKQKQNGKDPQVLPIEEVTVAVSQVGPVSPQNGTARLDPLWPSLPRTGSDVARRILVGAMFTGDSATEAAAAFSADGSPDPTRRKRSWGRRGRRAEDLRLTSLLHRFTVRIRCETARNSCETAAKLVKHPA
jgi:hypothetical protein